LAAIRFCLFNTAGLHLTEVIPDGFTVLTTFLGTDVAEAE
jgi:hypothetical protein